MVTRRPLLLMLPLLLTVSGCSDLILRESDSAGKATGKVLTRILLCPLTICFSELGLAVEKQDEERAAKQAAYWQWVRSLPPDQQAREYALEQARIQAAGQALMGIGMSGGLFKPSPPMPVYQPAPAPAFTPTQTAPFSCTSNRVGSSIQTYCY